MNTPTIDSLQAELDKLKHQQSRNSTNKPAPKGLKYVLIRGDRSGVFAGFLQERDGREVTLVHARRLFVWYGAFTLSALAEQGTTKPDDCKFSVEMGEVLILDAIEVIQVSAFAANQLRGISAYEPQ